MVSGAEDITVQLCDPRQFQDVQVVGTDPTTDIELLEVDGEDLPTLPIGSSDSTQVGA